MAKKDRIFHEKKNIVDFNFNKQVVNVFDDMVQRSVPFYTEVQRMIGETAAYFYKKKTKVFDLGCSTGTTLYSLMHFIKDPGAKFIGVDNSAPMIEKAKSNLKNEERNLTFKCADIDDEKLKFKGSSVVTMNWTLQFVRPIYRDALIAKIYDGLANNGIFIMSEKILVKHSELNRLFIELYYDYKRKKGYSESEITKKREALENVLIPYRVEENFELLKKAGFKHVDVLFRWYNWATFVAIKAK